MESTVIELDSIGSVIVGDKICPQYRNGTPDIEAGIYLEDLYLDALYMDELEQTGISELDKLILISAIAKAHNTPEMIKTQTPIIQHSLLFQDDNNNRNAALITFTAPEGQSLELLKEATQQIIEDCTSPGGFFACHNVPDMEGRILDLVPLIDPSIFADYGLSNLQYMIAKDEMVFDYNTHYETGIVNV